MGEMKKTITIKIREAYWEAKVFNVPDWTTVYQAMVKYFWIMPGRIMDWTISAWLNRWEYKIVQPDQVILEDWDEFFIRWTRFEQGRCC